MISDLIAKLRQSQIVRNMMTLSLGTFLAQIVPVLLTPVVSRIYTPAQFGEWGVFSGYVLIICILATGRYEMAILRPRNDHDAISICVLALSLSLFVSIVSVILMYILHCCGINLEIGKILIILAGFYIFANSLFQILSYYLNRIEKYKAIASGSVVRSLSQAIFRISLGSIKFPINGLVVGAIIGLLSGAIVYYKKSKVIITNIYHNLSIENIIRQAKIYKRFPLFEMPSACLNTISTNLPVILLAFYFNKSEVGYFTMAINLLYMPVSFIYSAQSQVFYKQACKNESQVVVGNLAKKIFFTNFYIAIIPLLTISLFGSSLFGFVLGETWVKAGIYSICFVPWIWLVCSLTPISTIFLIKDRQDLSFLFNLILAISRILSIIVGGIVINSIIWTMILYGATGFIVWVIEGIYIYRLCNINFNRKQLLVIGAIMILILGIWIIKLNTL